MADYAAVLKQYAECCEFTEFLEQALRDRFVCRLKNSAIQKKVLTEKMLTWQGAVDIVQAMESADKQAINFKNSPTASAVNSLSGARTKDKNSQKKNFNRKMGKSAKPCFRCGGDHKPQTCRFKEADCHFCKHKGHIEVCLKKGAANDKSNDKQGKPLRYVEEDDSAEGLFKIGTGRPEPSIVIPVAINECDISMELDTRATVSVISEETRNEKVPSSPLENSQLKLKTYTGGHLKIKGQAFVDVSYNGQNIKLPLQVIKGNGPALLGRNWLRTLKLDWGTIKRVTTDLETELTLHRGI